MSEVLKQDQVTHDDIIEVEMKSFENRWRYAVFPAMVAFVILAVFGFYLIFGMLQRMEALSEDVNRMTNIMEKSIPQMSHDMQEMNETIGQSLPAMEEGVAEMSTGVTAMSVGVAEMTISTHNIASTTGNMSNSVWEMNRSVSRPLSMMNKIMPFGKKTNLPRPTYTFPVQQKAPITTSNNAPVTTTATQQKPISAPVVPATYQQHYQQVQPQNPAPVNSYQLRYY